MAYQNFTKNTKKLIKRNLTKDIASKEIRHEQIFEGSSLFTGSPPPHVVIHSKFMNAKMRGWYFYVYICGTEICEFSQIHKLTFFKFMTHNVIVILLFKILNV